MTLSEPPPLPPPAMSPLWPRLPPPPPRPPAVPIDQAQRTSIRTLTLELIGLAGLGTSLIISVLAGVGSDVLQLWLALAAVAFRIASWRFRTYTVTDGELVLDEGILQKRHRVVPFSRIQQVELRQQLIARVLGLTVVQVETAGDASSTAVVLRFLEVDKAEALRDHLLVQQRRARGGADLAPAVGPGSAWRAPAPPAMPLLHLEPAQLLGAGATSGTVVGAGVVIGVGAAIGVVAAAASEGTPPLLAFAQWSGITGALVGITTAIVSVSTLARSWEFTLVAVGDDLHVGFGLLDRRQHTIPRHRLQHVTVVDNPLRRALGIARVHLHSGATPGARDGQSSRIEIPVIRMAHLNELLTRAMADERWAIPVLAPRPTSARRRAIVRRTIPCATLAAIGAVLWWPLGAALLPVALIGIPWGLLAHARAGWSVDGPILAFSSGALVHHTELIPRERVQSSRTTASLFQRRAHLRSLHIDLAGGRQHRLHVASGLMDLDAGDAHHAAVAVGGASR